jgi:hypothetical protein
MEIGNFSLLELIGVVGVVVGAVVALLRIIAPKTETTADDKALEVAEGVQNVINRVSED